MLNDVLAQLLSIADLRGFVELGGPVLLMVILAGFLMWLLIIERIVYLAFGLPSDIREFGRLWGQRSEHHSWLAKQIRHGWIAELQMRAGSSLNLIKTLIALAPLLGLLGTVTGMLEVFDVMALTGSTNARAMAAGISKATIPTMAGMVMALSGIYVNMLLNGWAARLVHRASYQILTLEDAHAPT